MILEKANDLFKKGEIEESYQLYKVLLRQANNVSYPASYGAGRSAGVLRKFQEAIHYFTLAAEAQPTKFQPLVEMANLYYRLGEDHAALLHLDKSIELMPTPSSSMLLLRLRILNRIERYDLVKQVCLDMLKTDLSKKGVMTWKLRLIRSFFDNGDLLEANNLAEQLVQDSLDQVKHWSEPLTQKPQIDVLLNCYQRASSVKFQRWWLDFQSIQPNQYYIWNNFAGKEFPQQPIPDSLNAVCDENHKFYGRFAYALMSQSEHLAVFDDDTIPGPFWLENCYRNFQKEEALYGALGVVVNQNDAYSPNRRTGWIGGGQENPEEVDLIGHAWFFKRDWLRHFWAEKPSTFDTGEDMHLSFCVQKHAKVRSIIAEHPAESPAIWGSLLGDELGGDAAASSNQKAKSHYTQRDFCVQDLVSRGWNLVDH